MTILTHPTAASHHIFGKEMPHDWVQALCDASAKSLDDHINGIGQVKIQPECQPMVEMLAALGKMLAVGLPTIYVDGANLMRPENSGVIEFLRHDLTGTGFVTFLMATPVNTGLSDIVAIHIFNRVLAHPSLEGLMAHVVIRGAHDAMASCFVDLSDRDSALLPMIEAVALTLVPAKAA